MERSRRHEERYTERYTETMMPLLPVIASGLVPFIVGSLWYHPSFLGSYWMQMKHITPDMAERSSRLALHSTAVMVVTGIFASFMLSHVLVALAIESVWVAVLTAFGVWLGFVVPATISRVLWDHMPLSLYGIETGQWLVSFCIMAMVLVI